MSPEAVALIIYAIETTTRLYAENTMTKEEVQKQAIQDTLRFAEAIKQINSEIEQYKK